VDKTAIEQMREASTKRILGMTEEIAVSLPGGRGDLTVGQYQALNPVRIIDRDGVRIVFCTPSRTTMWRVVDFFSNEPDTLTWISSFAPGDVFFDVGANMGGYSLWAAKKAAARVYAFEPESQNYAVLNKNILKNKADDLINAYCIALSDQNKISKLYLCGFMAGDSCHAFDEALNTQDVFSAKLEQFEPTLRQGCISFTIDELVASGLPVPRHIKIDVDGFEDRVIKGAMKTLEKRETASLLIETNQNLQAHREMVQYLGSIGFEAEDKKATNIILRREPRR